MPQHDDMIRPDGGQADAVTAPDVMADNIALPGVPMGVSAALAAVLEQLDAEEIEFFKLNQISGVPRAKCAQMLGWGLVKTDRVRRRLNLHLAKLRRDRPAAAPIRTSMDGDDHGADLERRDGRFKAKSPNLIYSFARNTSLNPFRLARLPSGLSTWELCPSKQIGFPTYRIIEAPTAVRSTGAKMSSNLQHHLVTEEEKLAAIAEKLFTARKAAKTAEKALVEAQTELAKETSQPLVEPMRKHVIDLDTTWKAQLKELDTAVDDYQTQSEAVQKIRDEIKFVHKAEAIELAKISAAKLSDLLDQCMRIAFDIRMTISGTDIQPSDILKTEYPSERYEIMSGLARFYESKLTEQNPELRAAIYNKYHKKYPGLVPETWMN
jgi:hypothetical protein